MQRSAQYEEVLAAVHERREALHQHLHKLYPDPCALTFEAGCGHGHYLAAYAAAHPEETCLGIDLVTKRVEKANRKVEKRDLHNARFLKAELHECLACLPPHVIFRRFFMLFADPWPKKRHHRRRMLNHTLLDTLAPRMATGGDFCFRTDHPGLFEWACEHFEDNPHWHLDRVGEWPFEHGSFFQDLMDNWQSLRAIPANTGEPPNPLTDSHPT